MTHYKCIGVTGHRDLNINMIDFYAKAVSKKLSTLKEEYKNILILSALADGADRLVVKEGLKLGIEFIAILPMYKSLYEKDFDESSKKEFDTLLSKSKNIINLGILEENSFECIKGYGSQRDKQYEAVGKKICEHSDVLLSLFDGIDNGLIGGTSETIKYFLKIKEYPFLYNLKVIRKGKKVDDTQINPIFKKVYTYNTVDF
jgi:hypothetical protein